jgi:hypothetical protein
MAPDPKGDLRDWLRTRFDDTAISVAFDPDADLVVANYDVGPSWPSVAIDSSDFVTVGGGQTGATAFDPGGAGAYQDGYYSIRVDCWGGPHDAEVYAGTPTDPDTVAEELGQELHRAARGGEQARPAGYRWSFADPPSDANTVQADPTEYRRQVTVRLGYQYEP